MVEELIPIVMFAGLTIVFSILLWFRFRTRREQQETIRMALDKGHELTPEIINRLGHPEPGKYKDLRLGAIWMSLAVALALIAQGLFEVAERFLVPRGLRLNTG